MRIGKHRRAVLDDRVTERESILHRDRLPRSIGEHPCDAVVQTIDMTAIARAPTEVRHTTRRAQGIGRGAFRADRRVEELLASLHDRIHRARRRQSRRLNPRQRRVLGRVVPRDVDHRDVARYEVHDIGARVCGVQDEAARILAADDVLRVVLCDLRRILEFDAHDAAGIQSAGWRVDGGNALSVHLERAATGSWRQRRQILPQIRV